MKLHFCFVCTNVLSFPLCLDIRYGESDLFLFCVACSIIFFLYRKLFFFVHGFYLLSCILYHHCYCIFCSNNKFLIYTLFQTMYRIYFASLHRMEYISRLFCISIENELHSLNLRTTFKAFITFA